MEIRPFQPADISAMADIQIECDADDALAQYMVKDIDQHPVSYRTTTCHYLKMKLLESGTVCWVAEAGQDIGKTKRIVGWTIWTRHGTSSTAEKWRRESSNHEQALTAVANTWPSSTYDITDTAHCNAISHITHASHPPTIFREFWEIDGLYIEKDSQRMGIGTALTREVLELAREESVPVVMRASPRGVLLYRSLGFRSYQRQDFRGFFDAQGPGYRCMFWDPKKRDLKEIAEGI